MASTCARVSQVHAVALDSREKLIQSTPHTSVTSDYEPYDASIGKTSIFVNGRNKLGSICKLSTALQS